MRNFLRHLRAAWLFGTSFPYIEEADADDFWTEDDSITFGNFMRSYTGKKLQMRLNNYATTAAVAAVKNPENPAYNNGRAAGIHAGIAVIASHLPSLSPADAQFSTSEEAEHEGNAFLEEQPS